MGGKTDGMLEKLADYEAGGISTKPLYDEWSQSYEADLLDKFGYSGHIIAADAFKAAGNRQIRRHHRHRLRHRAGRAGTAKSRLCQH